MGAAVGPVEQGAVDESTVLESLPTAMLVIDADGVIVRANRRAREILDRPTLVGTPAGEILGPWPMPRTNDVARSERTLPRRDGTAITLGFSMSSLPDGATTIVFQDITPWQRLREERDRLMQLAMVGEALPSILHELKNPLAALNAAVEILIEETAPGPVQDQLHAVLQEARRLRLGFDGVGAVGRALRSRRHQAVDQACRDSFRVLEIPARAAGINTRCDVVDLPLLPLDPAVVRAIVFNLVTNAIHACSPGDAINLHVRLVANGLALALTVADTGTGMTHDVYTRCTELFFTTKRNGSGIGLALVRQAVTEAGGELEIESVPGFGTCITALVPVIAAPRVSTPEEGTHVSRR
ncbi:MAG: PAS domain-containing protein [Myxococcales bacterium]|nr:PAS domain-containing protein [Myxococcales bacterium]